MPQIGEVIYTNKVLNPHKKTELKTDGSVIAMMLGYTEDSKVVMTEQDCRKTLMGLGWIPVDDIEAFLGEEAMGELILKLEAKYKNG